MFDLKITRIALGISFTIVFIMWVIYFVDVQFDLHLYQFGLYPKKTEGLIGILTSPFIHSTRDLSHIFNNSIPTFILSWMLFYHYRTIATKVFVFIYLASGITMWFFARESYHIGMSGVIYGLTSFLVLSGFFRKNMRAAAVSLFVIFLYGSMVWGIFPTEVGVSWEAHLTGLFSGLFIAVFYKNSGPQPAKMKYEIEEELGIEPEEEYWKEDYVPKQQTASKSIIINYTIVPKRPKVVHEQIIEIDEEE
jgi:membrane associated rhomboid family serine protease